MTSGRVVLDLVAPQSPSYRERGIARHGLDFANAVVDRHAELIDRVLLHPELPPAGGLEHLIRSGKAATDLDGIGPGGVFHVTSAFEPEVDVRALWPRHVSAARMRLAVTVYDLIPDIFPDMYLVDPGLRRRWRSCRELARIADHVFALSDSGADDVVRLLGVPAERVTVIGAGCDARFHRPTSRPAALAQARADVEGLGEHFLVYNGAIDPRKNLERLIEAFARLPAGIRDAWQLVLVCRAEPLQRNHLLVKAERLGIPGRVLVPGYVSDSTLVALYQSADLSVFPSLYEGYGLPVVEAQACGAPVIVADNSSLRELVRDEARFDAMDVEAMADAITRALTDEDLRSQLIEDAHRPSPTWGEVADRAAEVYEQLLDRDRGTHLTPGWRRRPAVAVVSPLPTPASPSAGADDTSDRYIHHVAAVGEALAAAFEAAGADVDRFADGPRSDGHLGAASLARMDRWRGGYDVIVCSIGDHPVHLGALNLLRREDATDLPIVVVAHHVALTHLYQAAVEHDPEGLDLGATLQGMYPGLPEDVGADGRLDPATVRRYGLVLSRAVIESAHRYLVATDADAQTARVDAHPAHAERIAVVPQVQAPGGDIPYRNLAEELLASFARPNR